MKCFLFVLVVLVILSRIQLDCRDLFIYLPANVTFISETSAYKEADASETERKCLVQSQTSC